jgi:hypothetical protein
LKLRHFATAFFTIALLCGCSSTPTAPPRLPPSPQYLLAEASADDFTCTRANAAAVDFDKFASGPELYVDKCVRTKGLASFRILTRDAATMPTQKSAAVPPSAIGLYWKDDAGMRKLDTDPQFVEVVGRVRLCDARNKLLTAAGSGTATEPCHSATVAIFVSQSHVFPTAMD